jgi:hypothetical protein
LTAHDKRETDNKLVQEANAELASLEDELAREEYTELTKTSWREMRTKRSGAEPARKEYEELSACKDELSRKAEDEEWGANAESK